ncbi:hypothetical protein GH714_034030 [Hevea brasiliensis]|uniref:Uncharacterized protein n=1 Tax=Hevea brasiliensis TaxID=3981 RepID=A0A6A6LLI1_HEVBR|nr:hypothetical protein GH714_034030 [Hevea brasiliensis]
MKEIVEVEERQRRRREVIEREENAKREREENEKKLKEAEKEQNERRLKAAVEHEENEKRQREVHEKEENEKSEPREKEGSEKRRAQEAEVSEVALKEDHKPEENRTSSQDTCEWEETEAKHIDVGESGKQKALNKMGKDHSVLNQACELGNDKSLGATQLPGKNEGNSEKLELTKEFANEETSKIMNELRNGEKEVASGIALGNLEDEKSQFLMEDSTDTEQKNIRSTFRVDLGIGNQGKKFPYEK